MDLIRMWVGEKMNETSVSSPHLHSFIRLWTRRFRSSLLHHEIHSVVTERRESRFVRSRGTFLCAHFTLLFGLKRSYKKWETSSRGLCKKGRMAPCCTLPDPMGILLPLSGLCQCRGHASNGIIRACALHGAWMQPHFFSLCYSAKPCLTIYSPFNPLCRAEELSILYDSGKLREGVKFKGDLPLWDDNQLKKKK